MKKQTKSARIFRILFTVCCICAYVGLTVILCVQALTPANKSSDISNSVGDKIDEIVTDVSKPIVEIVPVTSVEITSIKVGKKKISVFPAELPLGSSSTLATKVLPQNASNKALTYSSSDESVVKVNSNGKLQALALGDATITIASQENDQITFSVSVSVVEIEIVSLKITNLPKEIRVGQSHRLDIKFTPTNCSQTSVTWESLNKKILTVNKSGKITAIAEGKAKIKVVSTVNTSLSSVVEIEVLPKLTTPIIPVESIKILDCATTVRVGDSATLTTVLTPKDASDSLSWTSSDKNIATVSQKGLVSFLKAGSVTITAACNNYDFEDYITFTVKEKLSSVITLDTEDLTKTESGYSLKEGKAGKIKGILEEDATVLSVTYSSSDPSIASVSEDGAIMALKPGSVTITVTSSYEDESVQTSINLTVNRLTISDTIENFYRLVRKGLGHFGAFLVLGIFASFSYFMLFSKSTKGKVWSLVVCLIAGFAVAGLTEILQLPIFTQGRYCSFDDVLLDFGGYCSSTAVIYLIIFAVHFIKIFKAKRAFSKNN
ncbi:MAG: VanZ family protein [Clostridia bacterium]|nr:VanZ family protein [Clostridia bacterium]